MKRALISLVILAVAALAWVFYAGADGGISIRDAYARASNERAGAVFMVIDNAGPEDRLIGAKSDAAMMVEIHTHKNVDGVMQMREVEGGLSIPKRGEHVLKRGGDHVMFMGLKGAWEQGATVPLTLIFEGAGEITLDVPVDLNR